jgi:nucleoid-associated protein YgaU
LRPAAGTGADTAAAGTAAAGVVRNTAGRTPVRLTRRGRLVVTAAALLVVAAVSVILAGAAQALGHSAGPARLGPGITKVEVRPGQDLWSLAEAYDPNADTRQVIQEIVQLNSLSTDQVQPGQVLWMPRG